MRNEFDLELSPEVGAPQNVIVFEAAADRETIQNNGYGFADLFRQINERFQGTPRIVYVGDGSGSARNEIESLPQPLEIVGIGGTKNRMRQVWTQASTDASYVYPEQAWFMQDRVDYVIVQDIKEMDSLTLREINTTSMRLLKTGGVMYLRDDKEQWVGYMKNNMGELVQIPEASFDATFSAAA